MLLFLVLFFGILDPKNAQKKKLKMNQKLEFHGNVVILMDLRCYVHILSSTYLCESQDL